MYLCVDIGTSSIKAVEKDENGQVIRWGILERRGNPFHTSIQPIKIEDAAPNLARLVSAMGATATKAVASIPAFLAITSVAEAPDPKYVPAAPGTFSMSAVPVNEKFFLAAIPNAVGEMYADIFARAGLALDRITLESAALAAALGTEAMPVLIIDVGDRSTTFTVAQDGSVKYIEQTDFALASHAPDVIISKAEKIAANFKTKKNVLSGGAALLNLKGYVAPNSLLAIAHGL